MCGEGGEGGGKRGWGGVGVLEGGGEEGREEGEEGGGYVVLFGRFGLFRTISKVKNLLLNVFVLFFSVFSFFGI